ncbi:GM11698 [Drosophila sechellia]|uniref:GM11698 n=1 Tax=Drosophila sechellia TaxID=7238 RepID=B4IL11_DROSE|nr:GM11698 [Drosophila sechellia]
MDAVLLQASTTPAILGLDANAVSPMWLGKLSRHAEGQVNYRRGELRSEWMLGARVAALSQSTEMYTFDNYRASSDIDVTIVNEAASMRATYELRVDELELSDHNIITVVAEPTTALAVESIAPVPSWNFSNARWRLFKEKMQFDRDRKVSLRILGIRMIIDQTFWGQISNFAEDNRNRERILGLRSIASREAEEPSSFRTICLNDGTGKLLEKLVWIRLDRDIADAGDLSRPQFGFRKARSTVDAVNRVVEVAAQAIEGTKWKGGSKEFCLMVTLDIRNALTQQGGTGS